MEDNKILNNEQTLQLTEELINNIINTPDDEILEEVKEDYGDPICLADKLRNMVEKSYISTKGKNNNE